MKKSLVALMAGSAILAIIPAVVSAQPYGQGRGYGPDRNPGRGYGYGEYYRGDQGIAEREANIAQRIDDGERGGGLTRAEASRLRAQLRNIQSVERADMRGGLSDYERRDINRRL